jgi:predicted site-specific integrase-resolvase
MEERRLLTIPQAADEIGMSRVVLWRLVRKGTIPSIPAGRFRLIDADVLVRFQAKDRPQGWPKGKPRKPTPPQQP